MFSTTGFQLPVLSSRYGDGHFQFEEILKTLLPTDWWIDYGTGLGLGPVEAVLNPKLFKGRAIGVDPSAAGKEMSATITTHPDRLSFLQGTVEQLESSGKLKAAVPNGAAVSTDYFGAGTYLRHLDQAVRIGLSHTRVGGYYGIVIPTETYSFNGLFSTPATRILAKSNRAREYVRMAERLEIYGSSDPLHVSLLKSQYVGILSWAEAIHGVQIVAAYALPPSISVGQDGVVLIFKKIGNTHVPRLNVDRYSEASPPIRKYSW